MEHILTIENISGVIEEYIKSISKIPLSIQADSVLGLLRQLKREKVDYGPYQKLTVFESANRIMTDLTLLFGVKELLQGKYPEIGYDRYTVEYGNENYNDHDIEATSGDLKFCGEVFNVAPSFFNSKRHSAWKKLKNSYDENTQIAIIYNAAALAGREYYNPQLLDRQYHILVDVDTHMSRFI